jgi:rhodanese-related sulfurtransferase
VVLGKVRVRTKLATGVNRREKEVITMLEGFEVTVATIKQHMRGGDIPQFVEVRHHQDHDWSLYKARGAVRIDDDKLEQHLDEIPHDRTIVLYSTCPGDEASIRAAKLLLKDGWNDVHPLVGGFNAYLNAELPVENVSTEIPATKIMYL